jgi:CRISPR-associated protein Cas2
MPERKFFLISYDISNDRRRLKTARCLEALGERVQFSVFEVYLTPVELEKALRKMNKLLKPADDSLRIYTLCESCRGKVRTLGLGKVTPPPGVTIV